MSRSFEQWLEDFMQTEEYKADSFHWDAMARAAWDASAACSEEKIISLESTNQWLQGRAESAELEVARLKDDLAHAEAQAKAWELQAKGYGKILDAADS